MSRDLDAKTAPLAVLETVEGKNDRELDIWIAEHVFGWSHFAETGMGCVVGLNPETKLPCDVPEYSIEQAAAVLWEILLDGGAYSPWGGDDYGRTFCVICYEEHPDHHSTCVYVAACELFGIETKAG